MFRAFARSAFNARRAYSTAAPAGPEVAGSGAEFMAARKHIEEHAAGSAELWRKITYYVAAPAIIIALLNAKSMADEHEAHIEHIKHENGGELPERIVYVHFNKREKDLPWGPNTPFFNPKVNIPVE